MKVLITNIWLNNRGGTEVYVRDLAIALYKRGVQVEVYSPELGVVADEIRKAGIHVTSSVAELCHIPDIIHGHHYTPTLEVLLAFPGVPAIYLLHDRTFPGDFPPKHSQVIKYLATDYNTLDRLVIDEGIPEKHTGVIFNWVDAKKFRLKTRWSQKPVKALVFSNYAQKNNYLKVIREACGMTGLELDCIGFGVGRSVDKPENILMNYDIVFAKAKAGMEAMATGAMLIPCDFRGLGETVTPSNFSHLRNYNFGMKILNRPIEKQLLVEEIKKYDPEVIQKVAIMIREDADFTIYVDKLLAIYHQAINQYRNGERIYENGANKSIMYTEEERKVVFSSASEKNNTLNELLSAKLAAATRELEYLRLENEKLKMSLPQKTVRWFRKKLG